MRIDQAGHHHQIPEVLVGHPLSHVDHETTRMADGGGPHAVGQGDTATAEGRHHPNLIGPSRRGSGGLASAATLTAYEESVMAAATTPDRVLNYGFLLGGVTALIFGIIILIRGEEAFTLVVVLLGLWWLIHGAFMVFAVFVDSTDAAWKLALGALGMVAGILVLSNPQEGTEVLKGAFGLFLGLLGILVGIAAFVGAFRGGGIGAGVFGAVSVIIGLLVVFNREMAVDTLIILFAVLLLIDGVSGIYLGLKYRDT
jgi:uncharacterized membrane protein HdeD (DUF308 family)